MKIKISLEDGDSITVDKPVQKKFTGQLFGPTYEAVQLEPLTVRCTGRNRNIVFEMPNNYDNVEIGDEDATSNTDKSTE